MRARGLLVPCVLLTVLAAGPGGAGTPGAQTAPASGSDSISPADLEEWLTYIASDELEGRQVFTEGLGSAADYIATHLKAWGVEPVGDHGTYYQTVKVLGVRTTSRTTVTVDVNGQTRTFKDGEGITFPKNMGGKQTINGARIEFVGYGLQIPSASLDDYATVDPKGKVVVYIGQGPTTLPPNAFRAVAARTHLAVEKGAAAVITVDGGFGGEGAGGATGAQGRGTPPAVARGGFGGPPDNGDFTTVERYDRPVAPTFTAQDAFFDFVFSGSDVKYAELKDKASKHETLPRFPLKGATLTINVDPEYTIVRTRLTRNVVGVVPGADARLKEEYVAFGAHYDHIGYRQTAGFAFTPPMPCLGQTRDTPRPDDIINNGADDDGSGTVSLMALAKAFAFGPRPKRSVLFVWHSGEEAGLYGSRYNADHPVVPIEKIAAQLNIDMTGRNRCDDPGQENTVYLVGSDRISSELHNVSEDVNAGLATPLTLDYEFNDPADPESLYTRSDHYSYALKGIPIIFYTTGLHKDYHSVTDEVARIDFPKMAHIAQLVYATGVQVGNLDHQPVRDNKGPRKGKGATGKVR